MAERTEVLTPEAISLRMIEYGVELARDVEATAMRICAEVPLPCVTIRAALAAYADLIWHADPCSVC